MRASPLRRAQPRSPPSGYRADRPADPEIPPYQFLWRYQMVSSPRLRQGFGGQGQLLNCDLRKLSRRAAREVFCGLWLSQYRHKEMEKDARLRQSAPRYVKRLP